jgi:hypothetical protein
MNTANSREVTDRSLVVGVFPDRAGAERAVAELRRLGVTDDQIGVIARHGATAEGTQWEVGAAAGAVAGGATGTLLGIAVAAGLIPGIGPFVAGGLLGGLAASAAAGAVGGSVLGALIGMGIPEQEAAYYHGEFEAGRVLVTIKAGDRAHIVRPILRWHGGSDATTRTAGKQTEREMQNEGGLHRTEAARRLNADVERMSSPSMPPGV